MPKLQWRMESVVGALYILADGNKLCGISWENHRVPVALSLQGSSREQKVLSAAVKQLAEYFEGKRTEFDLPLSAEGTEFQKRVWNQLSKIPYGTTSSYREVAQRVKNPKAFRAVGTANGRNPIAIVVPCHRVIAADGTIGGYAGGLSAKKRLLKIERPQISL